MKIVVAAIQMPSDPLDIAGNLQRADDRLRAAHGDSVELAVLPEMFNTGYSLCPDFAPYSETADGPTITHLRRRSRQWRMAIAAGFVERKGRHLYDSLALQRSRRPSPHLPQAQPGLLGAVPLPARPSAPGRRDALGPRRVRDLRRHDLPKVWNDYRGRIDLAVVSAAWPDFANRDSGRRHWLLGHVGPLSESIPAKVASDLGIPVVFANQCGETPHDHPHPLHADQGPIRRPEQHLRRTARRAVRAGDQPVTLIAPITLHHSKGPKSWHFTSHSALAAGSSVSAHS